MVATNLKLCDLDQKFWVSFHKFLKIRCWNFGSLLSSIENWCYLKTSPFFLKYNIDPFSQTRQLQFHKHTRQVKKKKKRTLSLSEFANCNLQFFILLLGNGFILGLWPFTPCCCIVDNDTLLPALGKIFMFIVLQ